MWLMERETASYPKWVTAAATNRESGWCPLGHLRASRGTGDGAGSGDSSGGVGGADFLLSAFPLMVFSTLLSCCTSMFCQDKLSFTGSLTPLLFWTYWMGHPAV